MGDNLVDLFQRLVGEEADHAGRRGVEGADGVHDVPGLFGGDAAAALRHEDHADEVGPGLGGCAGVCAGVADTADLDPYHTWDASIP